MLSAVMVALPFAVATREPFSTRTHALSELNVLAMTEPLLPRMVGA